MLSKMMPMVLLATDMRQGTLNHFKNQSLEEEE